MAEDLIRYDILTQDALRAMIAKLLDEITRTGLPGDHHFFITFDTCAPKVQLSTRMKEKYPEEMTIVVQHRFWDLEVKEDHFQIGLSFDEISETLVVPFAAIKGFYDPSVKFGLQFELQVVEEDTREIIGLTPKSAKDKVTDTKNKSDKKPKDSPELFEELFEEGIDEAKAENKPSEETNEENSGARVVSLDSFRKKK
ncbi:MAG: hypothetical protein GY761_18190 [Hyphomicrobiales bacterium]|nr:hypothetical protein [Hyphomicrobiales bacterium]